MMKTTKLILLLLVVFSISSTLFGQVKKPTPKPTPATKPIVQSTQNNQTNKYSDYKITQVTKMAEAAFSWTIYAKGVRERREQKMMPREGASAEETSMMANLSMPTMLKQCDLKQDVSISDKKQAYFIDYYDWSGLSPDQLKRRPVNKPVVIKGTQSVSSTVTDSGKRQQMFGLTAKWLKHVTTLESSADSCDGKVSLRIEAEGWYVTLSLNSESCPVRIQGSTGGCRPKIIMGAMQNPGFFLTGTTKMYENNKLTMTTNIETTELSKATLDQALFEIPNLYKEVDSVTELMPGIGDMMDMSASTQTTSGKIVKGKTVAIDFFSGNSSKVNQDELRSYLSSKLSNAGMTGFVVNSQADLLAGNFVNVIGVELKKVKESGAAKIGGLFGKVTGNSDAGKLGESEAEIVITIYGKDGKSVVATATATEKIKGKGDDAVKAAIDKIIGGLLEKIK